MIATVVMAVAVAANAYITGKVVQGPAIDYQFATPELASKASGQDPKPPVPVTALPAPSSNTFSQTTANSGFTQSDRVSFSYSQGLAPESDPSESRLISVAFHGSKASEVLTWMERQGVSFIVSDEAIANRTITMNIVGKPLSSAVDGVAAVLGGHWMHEGAIRIFRSGAHDMSGFGVQSSMPGSMVTKPPVRGVPGSKR